MALELPMPRADYARFLRRQHERGQSVLALSHRSGIDRGTVGRLIREAGGCTRNGSQANYVRMENEGPLGRKRLAEAANKARRGSRSSLDELLNKAAAKCRLRGHGESELAAALTAEGLPIETQAQCGVRNIDIAVGRSVAVELVTAGNFRPETARFRNRIKHLRDRGWSVICVTFVHDRKDALIGNLKDVVAFIKRAYRSPTLRRKDWVIFCRSERFARIRNDLGQLTAMPMPERFFNVKREIYRD